MWSEFKAFLLKTNVVALALAFIVGVALAAVVVSLVNDIVMPPVGLLLGGADFQNMYWNISGKSYPNLKAARDAFAGAPIPADVEREILSAYQRLHGVGLAVAVRSSATAEDLPDAAFAGHDQFL